LENKKRKIKAWEAFRRKSAFRMRCSVAAAGGMEAVKDVGDGV